jgi:hypothetical protein
MRPERIEYRTAGGEEERGIHQPQTEARRGGAVGRVPSRNVIALAASCVLAVNSHSLRDKDAQYSPQIVAQTLPEWYFELNLRRLARLQSTIHIPHFRRCDSPPRSQD